ncbi:KH domain-containing protein [Candidatus Daviesbacteria bacterium]|nr:KH domain-containing protein [Candidatus Daviesbacteria bacterium]
MEEKVSEILENILGLLALEGSFEVSEEGDQVVVTIEATDSGRLIGNSGETLDALQLLVNQILSHQVDEDAFKRVVIDVGNWRKNKEADLESRARRWAEDVKQSGEALELDPMPAWQRRIVHLVIEEVAGITSESVGEGRDRHLIIKLEKSAPVTKEVAPRADEVSTK